MRRRQVRRISSVIAGVTIAAAVLFALFAAKSELQAQRVAKTEKAFRLLNRAGAATDEPGQAVSSYRESVDLFTELGLDPVMPLHGLSAEQLHTLRIEALGTVDGEVGSIAVSRDGEWLLVIYDYQAPNGSPELNDILDRTAFGVFHIRSRQWRRKEPIRTPTGTALYASHVDEFEAPDHVIVSAPDVGGVLKAQRVSLVDGTATAVDGYQAPRPSIPVADASPPRDRPTAAQRRLQQMLSTEELFEISPEDGVDIEYGPRLVDKTYEVSPDGRTALIGTYEGKLLLVDLPTGLKRGEIRVSSIFAAAYRRDSARAYVADALGLYEVETGGWPGVIELQASGTTGDMTTTAAAIADDGSMIGLATTRQLMARSPDGKEWRRWNLPRPVENVAVLRVDRHRSRIDFVSGDDGTIISVDYHMPGSQLATVANPNGSEPSVAWIDEQTASVWVTPTRPSNRLRSVPLSGGKGTAVEVQFSVANSGHQRIHAIAMLNDQALVFVGDELSADDMRSLDDEHLLRIPLGAGFNPSNEVIFRSETQPNGRIHSQRALRSNPSSLDRRLAKS